MLDEILEIINNNYLLDLITSDEYTTITPMHYFFKDGIFTVTSSVIFSDKLNNIRKNNKVTIHIDDLIIYGTARLIDNNIDTDWLRYKDEWFSKDRYAYDLYRAKDSIQYFCKRVIIKIKPTIITYKSVQIAMELI